MQKPTVLMILDGWGLAPPGPGNAISRARLHAIPKYWASYPHTTLAASGESVGLPPGEDGNTETGHINIGAGRIVYQDLPRINMAITDRSFFANEAFLGAISYVKEHHSHIHLMGLISDGAVHSKLNHLFALLEIIQSKGDGMPAFLHLFTDGRDSPPKSGQRFIETVQQFCTTKGIGTIATVIGRYFAMDRDRRWERTQKAYDALTQGSERVAPTGISAVQAAYAEGKTDEFIEPTVILDASGMPTPRVRDHDAVIFFNFRIDRPRQLTKAFVVPDFETHSQAVSFDPYAVKYYHKHIVEEDSRTKPFQRNIVIKNLFFVTMTEYERNLSCTVAYPPDMVKMPLGRVLADQGLRQLRMSETEKERFIGYYFNGMREDPFPGEDHLIIPSSKVATYDLQPEMSAYEMTDKLIDRLSTNVYSCIVINLANADMVAHTGNILPAVRACEVVDECVGKIVTHVLSRDGTCVITADHGNVEEMLGPGGEVDTEHSVFPVPFIMIDKKFEHYPMLLPSGSLSDIAPTLLTHMGITVPSDMTGRNLLIDMPSIA